MSTTQALVDDAVMLGSQAGSIITCAIRTLEGPIESVSNHDLCNAVEALYGARRMLDELGNKLAAVA